MLATINSECQRAQFLLLTPFIENAREVARWLGGQNSDDISLALDWQPNDRVIGIVQPEKGDVLRGRSYDYSLRMETVHTTRHTLSIDELLDLPKCSSIAATYATVANQGALAAVTAQKLGERGPVIVLHSRPDFVWSLACRLKIEENRNLSTPRVKLVQEFLELEFGSTFLLIELLQYGVGVHHAGLSDDVRALMEWLFEEGELRFLVATTTVAQGVNFPVSGVVMASHQYPQRNHQVDMPPEDFWNIAGRAGRISQGALGVVALVANEPDKADALRAFIGKQSGALNSALITLVREAGEMLSDLEGIVYRRPEWSTFVQYLSHTYRQMGQPEAFADDVEQVLRGTFGFDKLRTEEPDLAAQLLGGVHTYTQYLQKPGQPLKLVDSTGFSLQSIKTVLTHSGEIGSEAWDSDSLFSKGSHDLRNMMGVLLRIPELRDNLKAVTGGDTGDGDKLAFIVKDWVNGVSVPQIASRYFTKDGDDETKAMTVCGKNLYGRLTQTAAWGARRTSCRLLGMNSRESELEELRNLPSWVFYGVNNDSAIALRLLGVPRFAASKLAASMGEIAGEPLTKTRIRLREMSEARWQEVSGRAGRKGLSQDLARHRRLGGGVMTEALYTRIAIPEACLLDKRTFKRMVKEYGDMTAAEKRTLSRRLLAAPHLEIHAQGRHRAGTPFYGRRAGVSGDRHH